VSWTLFLYTVSLHVRFPKMPGLRAVFLSIFTKSICSCTDTSMQPLAAVLLSTILGAVLGIELALSLEFLPFAVGHAAVVTLRDEWREWLSQGCAP